MPVDLAGLPLSTIAAILLASALAIGYAGTKLAGIADQLADRTGLGEITAGAVFVGASTSLPGAITSMVTAAEGYPGLAIGNALGGLTAQTTFLAVADLVYRRANLEHAAASVNGLTQGTLLVSLLTIPLLAAHAPAFTILGVHPGTHRAACQLRPRPPAARADQERPDVVTGADQGDTGRDQAGGG